MRESRREDHELFRTQVRRFVEREIAPHHAQWERDGFVPKDVWRKAGRSGLLCCLVPEAYGGTGGDFGHSAVIIEELARANATAFGITTHSEICAPYILAYGTDDQKRRWLTAMASGEAICAIAMTEPGIGSDLRSLRTTAVRDGDHFVVSGQKTFITNGLNADFAIVAVKIDPRPADKKITLMLIDANTPGFTKGRKLEKIGLRGQDTCELFFDNVRVPVANVLGEEHEGFGYLMHELAQERMIIALRAATSIEVILEETIDYTRNRQAFGQAVFDYQNTRFKLAQAKAEVTMLRVFIRDHAGNNCPNTLKIRRRETGLDETT
ncbi:MAG: acyl-CoA dehydrogenase [Alphaproteobacteria bacterium]|nr:MAG: acyl-CoA dehydrogenase [Alphaproteobacteria bacterium]